MRFEGKSILVTGAGGGIGREVARHLWHAGGIVTASDLPGRGADAALDGLSDNDDRFTTIDADISNEEDVASLIEGVAKAWGRLDVLVNVAAITGPGLEADLNVVTILTETWDRIIAVNLRGTMLMCKHAIPLMLDGGGGAIVNLSSRSAAVGGDRLPAYSASKAGINSLTMHIAKAFGKRGIRCNAIMPGVVQGTDSTRTSSITPDQLAAVESSLLVSRLGVPSDVAHLVAFLASDDQSGYITGQIFNCDGGQSASRVSIFARSNESPT